MIEPQGDTSAVEDIISRERGMEGGALRATIGGHTVALQDDQPCQDGGTRLLPSLPEARATTRLCDRDDVEVGVTDPIDDLVRESRNEHASMW